MLYAVLRCDGGNDSAVIGNVMRGDEYHVGVKVKVEVKVKVKVVERLISVPVDQ